MDEFFKNLEMSFLSQSDNISRPLNLEINGLNSEGLFLGNGRNALEIAIFSSIKTPKESTTKKAYKDRRAQRSTPVLIIILHSDGATICGIYGENPPIRNTKDIEQIERICEAALNKPDRNSAINFLSDSIPTLDTNLPGINNEGFISLHELNYGTRERSDWSNASKKSKFILDKKGKEIISELGFKIKKLDNLSNLFFCEQESIAVGIFLNSNEIDHVASERFNNISPIVYGLIKADQEKIPWVFLIQEERIRIYSTENIAISKRSRTETYIECQLSIISNKDSAFLWLLFSAEALKENGTIYQILEESERFAASVADKLRERIYGNIIPKLASSISNSRGILNPTKKDLSLTYEMTIKVLFRILFVAYAEDRDLLPFKTNEAYRKNSLKQKANELKDIEIKKLSESFENNYWEDTKNLWKNISNGNKELGIPAYEGTIFSYDPNISQSGAALDKLQLPNNEYCEILANILLRESNEEKKAPIDFRSLSVREFGTIYEGLLESELSVAETDLAVDKKGKYYPTKIIEKIAVKKGETYLHNRSGDRKSSASFYTRNFAVEDILDKTLEPAIDEHFKRLTNLNDVDQADNLFSFRVADISMGSGHFLVAAIDRIERRFAIWLKENPNPVIKRELQYLSDAAKKEIGELTNNISINESQLLRRMIARRCIYGVDINPLAVQLSRLSIWIHSFVPGLPLSLLDHNLVNGNALIGIDSLDQIQRKLAGDQGTIFAFNSFEALKKAAEPLNRLANITEASIKDIQLGRSLLEEAKLNIQDTEILCDLITAQSVSKDLELKNFLFENWDRQKKDIKQNKAYFQAKKILSSVNPLHFPIAFPEVFTGKTKGFNVIIGNPPWEEIVINEDKYWARYYPGLNSLKPRAQELKKEELRNSRPDLVEEFNKEFLKAKKMRQFLHAGNFPGMGTGDPDLYKAFLWRFWFVSSEEIGRIGVVLPREAMSAKGSEIFRRKLLSSISSIEITSLENSKRWVFDIHPQQTICLVSITKKTNDIKNTISLRGPYNSLQSFNDGKNKKPNLIKIEDVFGWNESASLPLLPSPSSLEIFCQIRKSPWLSINKAGEWRARPDGELHATAQKQLFDFSEEQPKNFWPVYKGESFNIWNPDTHLYNAWADPNKVLDWLQEKRLRAFKSSRDSIHKEYSEEFINKKATLSPNKCRIAFRDITNRTNTRTVIACLIPPKVFITNTGPVIQFPRGDEKDEAYLLGILCSIPLDWYARRFVEKHVNFFIFNPFPIPRPNRNNQLWKRLVELSGRLASIDHRFSDWATKVGVDHGGLTVDEKNEKIYEIDALAAHLYGLTKNQLIHIYETFHHGWDFNNYLDKVLKYYQKWDKSF